MLTFCAPNRALFFLSFVILISTTTSLICYDCKNCSLNACPCEETVEVTDKSYCVIERETNSVGTNVNIKPIGRYSTLYNVTDAFYISMTETIRFDETTKKWVTNLDKTAFGCQTDKCNRPDLIAALPKSVHSLSLEEKWLDENIRRKSGVNSTLCHHCPDYAVCGDTQYFIDMTKCAEKQCNGLCAVTDKFNNPKSTEFCYQSICDDDASLVDPHEIIINAIYYIKNKEFEIWEINIFCQAENCTRLEIFQDIKDNLKEKIDVAAFMPKNNGASLRSISILLLISLIMLVHRF